MLLFTLILLVPASQCAKRQLEPFISGGRYASIKDFPHAVFMSIKNTGEWICGASIVNQKILLTAAHCLQPCVESEKKLGCQIHAYAGTANLNTANVIKEVVGITCHEHYDDIYVENDVALALVHEDLPLGHGHDIKRVMLAQSFPQNLAEIEISGWGIIDERTRETSVRLKAVKQRMLPRSTCATAALIHPGTMCAGSIVANEGPTSGDSGSAVVTSSHQQIGLVSYRSSTDNSPERTGQVLTANGSFSQVIHTYLYYTNVSYYYKWINRNAVILYCTSN